jgi:hypothetical protein
MLCVDYVFKMLALMVHYCTQYGAQQHNRTGLCPEVYWYLLEKCDWFWRQDLAHVFDGAPGHEGAVQYDDRLSGETGVEEGMHTPASAYSDALVKICSKDEVG